MTGHEPFVDIHCHLLPGLDDGASSLDDALAMAAMAVADGVGTIIATPHQLGKNAGNSGQSIRAAAERLQRELDRRRLPLKVLPGADVRIEPDLPGKICRGEVVTLADRRRHVLLELPHDVYLPLDRLLADLSSGGVVGILSHPERNVGILNQPKVLPPLIERGCLLQITAGSLTGVFGARIQRFAELLVADGLVHFVASDAHSVGNRSPILSAAFRRVAGLAGDEAARELCCRNPAHVAAGRPVPSGRRSAGQPRRLGWFRRVFALEASKVGTI